MLLQLQSFLFEDASAVDIKDDISDVSGGNIEKVVIDREARLKFKKYVEDANAYKCS